MQVALPNLKPQYLAFGGGLDTTKERTSVAPGMAQASQNYEPQIQGGYRRLGGHERFDGRARPSDATYTLLDNTSTFDALAAIGATVNGQTSGATGYVCDRGDNWLAVTQVVGTFSVSENIRVGVTVVGAYGGSGSGIDVFRHNEIMAAAAEVYRPAIQKPAGSGGARVMCLAGEVYAIRNNAGGTAADLWKATTSGWSAVPLMRQISFTAGTSEYSEGETLSQGGVTATVRRVVLASGDWGPGTAAGKLIISDLSGGEFTAGVAAGGGAATLSGASTAITLLPNGSLDYITASFVNNQERIYACDGVNLPFEFDGTILVPIDVPSAVKPTCVESDEVTLYFGCGAEVFASSTGDPYTYSVITGAAQIGAGASVTDLLQITGGQTPALFVGTTRGPKVLYGSGKEDWQLVTLGSEGPVSAYSAQPLNGGLFFDVAGARSLKSTQDWGNFSYGLESRRIDSWLRGKNVTAAALISGKSLYRVFFDDGTGLSATYGRKEIQWMPISYGVTVRQMTTGMFNGRERVFFCDDSGWVFEADVGRSADGGDIEAWMMSHSVNAGSVALIATWRSGLLEANGESAFSLRAQAEFDDGDPEVALGDSVDVQSGPVGMRWDADRWDAGVWDGGALASMKVSLRGVGATVAIAVYSISSVELPHTITGLHYFVTPRRFKR